MNDNKCLRIAAFLDGSPGHEKQTQGILKYLDKRISIDVIFVKVQKSTLFHQVKNWCKLFFGPHFTVGLDLSDRNLLIGTGTHTHLEMLLYKKKRNTPVVSCMTPSSLLKNRFDLLFIPHHDNVSDRENIVKTIGPPGCCENAGVHDLGRVLILIGGTDPKSHAWNSELLVSQIESLLAHDSSKKFIISSSPRTPAETNEKISALSRNYENAQFFEFKDTEPGWVEKEYCRCKYVWVTGDSISMVYEALSSGCKVGIIPVMWRKKTSKFLVSENYLITNRFAVTLKDYLNKKVCWKNDNVLNEAERCAGEIIRRWA